MGFLQVWGQDDPQMTAWLETKPTGALKKDLNVVPSTIRLLTVLGTPGSPTPSSDLPRHLHACAHIHIHTHTSYINTFFQRVCSFFVLPILYKRLKFNIFLKVYFYFCVNVYMWVCVCMSHVQMLKEARRWCQTPEAEVTGSFKPPNVSSGNWVMSPQKSSKHP